MKKIIDGKTYNTETAEYLGEYSYSNSRDFHYCSEELYQTKKGTYFLYGEGGPLSKYAVPCGNRSYSAGEDIKILTEKETQEWAEDHLSSGTYCNIFGEPEEG